VGRCEGRVVRVWRCEGREVVNGGPMETVPTLLP
jgi:hypothetical protein